MTAKCPECDGTGKGVKGYEGVVSMSQCATCGGTGLKPAILWWKWPKIILSAIIEFIRVGKPRN